MNNERNNLSVNVYWCRKKNKSLNNDTSKGNTLLNVLFPSYSFIL